MAGRDPSRARTNGSLWVVAVVLAVAILVPLTVYTVRFVAAEQTLYRADQLAYWSYSAGLARGLTTSPVSAVAAIADSVANQELNLLPATPIATVMAVIGPSRLAYLSSVLNLYGLAVIGALLFALATLRPEGARPEPASVLVGAALAILMLPSLWYPVFKGYLGLGGVALGIVVLALYLRRPSTDLGLKELLLIGFLVGLLAIFRRWYAFWSVAFCAVVLLEALGVAWSQRDRGRRAVLDGLRAPAVIGLAAAGTLSLLAAPVVFRRLGRGYAEEFVGFASGGALSARLAPVVAQYGELTLLIVLVAVIAMVLRDGTGRRIATVIGAQVVFAFVMMVSLQDHDPQHWYLYAPGLLALMGVWAVRVLQSIPSGRRRWLAGAGVVVMGAVVSATVLIPAMGSLFEAAGPILPGLRVLPTVRTDLGEVNRLLGDLDTAIAHRPGYIYVLGCTSTLSEQSLAFANLSLGTSYRSPAMILQSAHVDRRDGFPRTLIHADYVVVPDPVQVNLEPSQQQVVVIPSESLLKGANIAKAFARVPGDYEFEGGVRVSVFERIRPIRLDEIAELSELLRQKYPDRPDIYLP